MTVGASLWESTLALVVTFGSFAATALLAFVSGFRGERKQWNVSPLVHGTLTALIALGVTFGGVVIVNFRTDSGLTAPVSGPRQWAPLVEAAAQDSDEGRVLSVICDRKLTNGDLASCAVTFEGPVCQYWFVGNAADGEDEARPGDEIDEGSGYYDEEVGPLCDWPLPESSE